MSVDTNTELLERAAEMIDYWEGTLHARLIEADIDSGDLESLRYHVTVAEGQASQQEIMSSQNED